MSWGSAHSLRARVVLAQLGATAFVMTVLGAILVLAVWAHLSKRVADDLRLNLDDFSGDYATAHGDAARMRRNFLQEKADFGERNLFAALLAPDGHVLADTANDPRVLRKMTTSVRSGKRRFRVSVRESSGKRLVVQAMVAGMPDGRMLVVGRNTTGDEKFIAYFIAVLACALLVSFVPASLVADRLARKIGSALSDVSETAGRIKAGEWSARVPPSDTAREIKALGDAFNAMARRNETTIRELRTLTDDIAHDLRTPLTRMRTASELAAMGGALDHPLPELVLEQSSAMLEMINTMLSLSRTEYETGRTPREDVDLARFVRDIADLYATVFDDNRLALLVSMPEGPATFAGHRGKLQQMLGNLLDNAIKFTQPGGTVSLQVADTGDALRISVSDTGCGIRSEDIPRVFDRFWRADSSRSLPGNGLGLALVKAIATSYGGTATCSSEPGKGSTFEVLLPKKRRNCHEPAGAS